MQLVLSLFPGVDLLGLAFKHEGCQAVRNAVPMSMGRAIARAVKEVLAP